MTSDSDTVRHFTATGFIVRRGSIAIHWHPKVRAWLPPGGHVEPNEDPVEAVVREALEETGLRVEVAPTSPSLGLSYPEEVTPPFTIMVEDIHDPVEGFHKHIDMIYFCRPVGGSDGLADGWRWVSRDTLEAGLSLTNDAGHSEAPPEDVRALGIRAIDFVEGGTTAD